MILSEMPLMTQIKSGSDLKEADIVSSLSRLTEHQQREFHALSAGGLRVLTPLVRKYKTNAIGHEWRGLPSGSSCVCIQISRFNHSCIPDAQFVLNEASGAVEIRALKPIREGAEITVCYFGELNLLPAPKRALHFAYLWGFSCDCPACKVDSNFGYCSQMRRCLIRHLLFILHFGTFDYLKLDSETDVSFEQPTPFTTEGRIPTIHLTLERRTFYWFLVAKLLLAEGLCNELLGRALREASLCLGRRYVMFMECKSTAGRRVFVTTLRRLFSNMNQWIEMSVKISTSIEPNTASTRRTLQVAKSMKECNRFKQMGELVSSPVAECCQYDTNKRSSETKQ